MLSPHAIGAPMILCLDVDYRADATVTGCVGIRDWTDAAPTLERARSVTGAQAPYEPGSFYLRELPHLVAMIGAVGASAGAISGVVIDGYVWLAVDRPGLGARLHGHLVETCGVDVPVVGVAKKAFRDNDCAIPIVRGGSVRPLYITAIGIDATVAAARVLSMHGAHRLPTMLKRVDRLARDAT
jgi:deoxyribonuclease V